MGLNKKRKAPNFKGMEPSTQFLETKERSFSDEENNTTKDRKKQERNSSTIGKGR